MLLFAVGLSMQYRAWYLGPMALYAAWQFFQSDADLRDWRLALTVVLSGLAFASLGGIVSGGFQVSQAGGFVENRFSLLRSMSNAWVAALYLGGFVWLALYERSPWRMMSIGLAIVYIFTIPQWQFWYPVVMFPAVGVVRSRVGKALVLMMILHVQLALGDTITVFSIVFDTISILG
jgi:hypothetical protein